MSTSGAASAWQHAIAAKTRQTIALKDSKDFKDSWFDLSGRKLTGKPVQPGLYINGGSKVVIK